MASNVNCDICGAIHQLDRHHVVPKRMGGRKNPAIHHQENMMTLCRHCHRKIHDGRWEVDRSPEGIWVTDKRTGDLVMRRLSNPLLEVWAIFQLLNTSEENLSNLARCVPYLTDDQLVEAFDYATTIGKRCWMIRASILYETQQRSAYGESALESMASRFGISRRLAWKYAQVWKAFFAGEPEITEDGEVKSANVETFSFEEPSWYVVAATETNDPQKWLGFAQDRKAEDPRYSVSWFRQDIQRSSPGDVSINNVPSGGLVESVTLPDLEHAACPWIRPMCTKSGKPIPFEDCQECEFKRLPADA